MTGGAATTGPAPDERGRNRCRLGHAFLTTLAGNAPCLVIGAAWLAVLIGVPEVIAVGVLPFILGGVLKSALAAATQRARAAVEAGLGGSSRPGGLRLAGFLMR